MGEPLMTLKELCERLRCTESWARDQLEARRWPITWVARSYRFTEDDYQQILRILAEPPADRAERFRSQRRMRSAKRPLKG